ncbi:MAG: bifunctional nuclease family protein [Syntrophorhabdaceae bacterium]|nr:bifunctional nuclease family protein [Syntrophorhabdaceae bacterium]MDD4195629.1 bifunctional nuclease family protein [Syntrophorhabdaceae bacterium]HOC46541.1 bifunctional nuclease family protein [Syntrophorhabdaceae bacterium]
MLKEMKVAGITVDPFTNTPIILLKDVEEKDVLPIWIGLLEASSIATALENIETPRPMTHDLIKNILDSLGVKVLKIEVNDLKDNTYYALIHVDVNKKRMVIDSRPSDAIAIALRTKAPIFVEESVIQRSAKVDLTTQKEDKVVSESSDWEDILENLSQDDFGKYKM